MLKKMVAFKLDIKQSLANIKQVIGLCQQIQKYLIRLLLEIVIKNTKIRLNEYMPQRLPFKLKRGTMYDEWLAIVKLAH